MSVKRRSIFETLVQQSIVSIKNDSLRCRESFLGVKKASSACRTGASSYLINSMLQAPALRGIAVWMDALPRVERSPDPFDNFLLAMAEGGQAEVLVSGDKRGVLALKSHGPCRIVTVRQLVDELALVR